MATSARPPANAFVAAMRRLYNPVGFAKGYNFVLWVVFAGAMMGFALARLMYLDVNGIFCSPNSGSSGAAPGECWAYSTYDAYLIGIKMHLYTIIPAGFLVCFQFIPVIRHKVILVHRLNGYLVVTLSVVGMAGALMVARVAFGGGLEIQTGVGLMVIMFIGSLGISLYNIKRLQIEQHRAWMLRAWFYAGSIITMRIVMILSVKITTKIGSYHRAMPCREIYSLYQHNRAALVAVYPVCSNLDAWTAVAAGLGTGGPESAAATLDMGFGMALWLSLAMHTIGVEAYLCLTPAETERLRNVSYQRQLEAGYNNPGRAGLTADRIGDADPWVPRKDSVTSQNLAGCQADEGDVSRKFAAQHSP